MADTLHTEVESPPGAHGAHDEGAAGHEIDSMPNRRLFNLLFGLSALVLAASIAVVQLFNRQVAALEQQRIAGGFYGFNQYQEEMRGVLEGSGVVTVREVDGTETQRYYRPVAATIAALVEDPEQLEAREAYSGWDQSDTAKAIEELERKAKAEAMPPDVPATPTPGEPADGTPATTDELEPDGVEAVESAKGAAADSEGADPDAGGQLPPPKGTAPTKGTAPPEVPPAEKTQPLGADEGAKSGKPLTDDQAPAKPSGEQDEP